MSQILSRISRTTSKPPRMSEMSLGFSLVASVVFTVSDDNYVGSKSSFPDSRSLTEFVRKAIDSGDIDLRDLIKSDDVIARWHDDVAPPRLRLVRKRGEKC